MNARRILFLAILCLFFGRPATAEVVDSSPQGFTTRNTATVAAPPERVYDTLVKRVGQWWNPLHSWSGDSNNLSIDDRAGGCFCEKLGTQGGVVHATVILAKPGSALRMTGALGPLQELAVVGTLGFALEPDGDGTKVTLTYRVGGYVPADMKGIDGGVDFVMQEQLQRLKTFVETGKPAP